MKETYLTDGAFYNHDPIFFYHKTSQSSTGNAFDGVVTPSGVHFFHRRNQLISYRQFSAWEEAGEQAINRCTSGEELQAFADAVNIEKQRFQHIYQHQETVLQPCDRLGR